MPKYILIPLFAILLFVSCNSSSSDTPPVQPVPPVPLLPQKTTVMVYIPGTDLERNFGSANRNISAMLKAESSDLLNIVMQTGTADIDYDVKPTTKYATPVKNWRIVQRFNIKDKQLIKRQELGKSCISNKVTTDCLEMGTPEAITDFINYSVKEYPADRYILVLWDHGSGPVGGYGGGGLRKMDMDEVMKALEMVAGKVKFDIIGFDACVMGSAEIAYNLRNYGKYLVASEELESGRGWEYTSFFNAIATNPKISSADIGKAIVDGFILRNQTDARATLSVIDMSKMEPVINEVDSLAANMLTMFNTDKTDNWLKIYYSRSDTEEYAADKARSSFYNLIDVVDFGKKLKIHGKGSFDSLLTNFEQTVKNAVVYNKTNSEHTNSTGISIFFPYHFVGIPSVEKELGGYNGIYYSKDKRAKFSPKYAELLTALVSYAETTPTEFRLTTKPVIATGKVSVSAVSNFGLESSSLLVNKSTVAGEYRFMLSDVVDIEHKENMNYNLNAKSNGSVLTLNGFETSISINNQEGNPDSTSYNVTIPVYLKRESYSDEEHIVFLQAVYDFASDGSYIYETVKQLNSLGRDNIKLKEGDIIIIPDIYFTAANPTGIMKPTTKTITLDKTVIKKLFIKKSTPSPDSVMTFFITSMRGENKLSEYFTTDGKSLKKFGMETDEELQAIADALGRPIETQTFNKNER